MFVSWFRRKSSLELKKNPFRIQNGILSWFRKKCISVFGESPFPDNEYLNLGANVLRTPKDFLSNYKANPLLISKRILSVLYVKSY